MVSIPRISHYVCANIPKSDKKPPKIPNVLDKGHLALIHLPSSPALPRGSGGFYLLFCRDVAIHQRAALHTGHLDMGGNVPKF
jgi:hypothetical protein